MYRYYKKGSKLSPGTYQVPFELSSAFYDACKEQGFQDISTQFSTNTYVEIIKIKGEKSKLTEVDRQIEDLENNLKALKRERAKEKEVRTYPYLGFDEQTKMVVLFSAPCTGTVLRGNKYRKVGLHLTKWIEDFFVPILSYTLNF